jgi:hypothetical protein
MYPCHSDGLPRPSRLTVRFSSLACQVASVNASSLRSEFGPPPCQRSSVLGCSRWGPDHGGGPLLSLQHNRLLNDFNPVNHPFRLSGMTENGLELNPSRARSGLDQTAANGITHQTCCFVDIELLHESCSMRFCGFYADPQLHSDVFRGLSFTN